MKVALALLALVAGALAAEPSIYFKDQFDGRLCGVSWRPRCGWSAEESVGFDSLAFATILCWFLK